MNEIHFDKVELSQNVFHYIGIAASLNKMAEEASDEVLESAGLTREALNNAEQTVTKLVWMMQDKLNSK